MTTRILVIGVVLANSVAAAAQEKAAPRVVPVERMPGPYRDRVAKVIQAPTLTAYAVPEELPLGIYDWLLEHPDRAALAWRRLGINCAEIQNLGHDRFGWGDNQGTAVTWAAVYRDDGMHVWYAEGQAKPTPVLPTVPFKAVAVIWHGRKSDAGGNPVVKHDAHVFLQTDNKAAALVSKLLGPSVPKMAEEGTKQLLLFYSGLTRYFEQYPEDIQELLRP